MAEVFLAIQQGLAGFEKLVVIKRILPHLCQDGQFVQMFLNEARLAASLSHPNIVQIFDVHRDEGSFFIAMEYLSGEDLRYIAGKFRNKKMFLPVPVACRLGADAAAGLHAAHQATDADGKPKGIVHRDIAPSNIIVCFSGTTKLVDFGVAKANVHNIYTRPGTLKGKFAYISPEQIQHKEIDYRSDVFSLGVVLWEMLTAQRLFKGPSEATVLRAVMEEKIPPPSSVNPEVPSQLDEVVLSALRRNREARTKSAGLVRTQLEQVLKQIGESVSTHTVAEWMQSTFKERYKQRRALEKGVTNEAREPSSTTPTQVPPMFSSGALAAPASSSTSTPASAVVVQGVPSSSGNKSPAMLVILTAIGTLAIVVLVGLAYWLGRSTDDATDRAMVGISPEPTTTRTTEPRKTEEPAAAKGEPVAVATKPKAAEPAPGVTKKAPAVEKKAEPTPAHETKIAAAAPRRPSRRARPRSRTRRPTRIARLREKVRSTLPRSRKPEPAPVPVPAPELPKPAIPAPKPQPPKKTATAPAPRPRVAPKPAPKPRPRPAPARPTPTNGKLRVLSDTPGYIFIDGKNTGKTTPATIKLPVGVHQILIILKGSNSRIRHQVRIKPGKVITLRLKGSP